VRLHDKRAKRTLSNADFRRSSIPADDGDSGRAVGKPEVIQTGSGDQYREVGQCLLMTFERKVPRYRTQVLVNALIGKVEG
jgi:hypothetical protein